jgi:hypothetical protein
MIRDCHVSRNHDLPEQTANAGASRISGLSPKESRVGKPEGAMPHLDIDLLMRHIEATIDLAEAAKGPPSYWVSLPLCVIDSVWCACWVFSSHPSKDTV